MQLRFTGQRVARGMCDYYLFPSRSAVAGAVTPYFAAASGAGAVVHARRTQRSHACKTNKQGPDDKPKQMNRDQMAKKKRKRVNQNQKKSLSSRGLAFGAAKRMLGP